MLEGVIGIHRDASQRRGICRTHRIYRDIGILRHSVSHSLNS